MAEVNYDDIHQQSAVNRVELNYDNYNQAEVDEGHYDVEEE